MEEHSNKLHLTINRDYSSSDSETLVSLNSSLLLGTMEFFCVLLVSIGSISCLLDILNPFASMNGSVFRLCFFWSLCFTILFHLNKPRLYAAISLLLFTIYLFFNYQLIILGCKYLFTLIVEGINLYYFVNLPSFPAYSSSKDGFVLLISCFIFLLTLLFSYTLVCNKKTIYIIEIAIFIPLMGLMIGTLPDKTNLLLTILSLFFTIPLGSRRNFYGRRNSTVYAICCGICMFLTLFSLPMAHWIGGKTSPFFLQHHSNLINAEKAVEASIISGSWYYDLFLSGSFSLFSSPPGTLNNNSPNFSGIPIMEVTLDAAPTQSLYLKDWVGGNYKNNAWSSISEENFAKISEKFSIKTKEDAARRVHNLSYKHFQDIDLYATSLGRKRENTMTITKLQKSMSEIPFPYFCKIPAAAIPVADGYYSKETPFESITYQGYPLKNIFSYDSIILSNLAYYVFDLAVLQTFQPEEDDSILEKAYQNYVWQEYLSVPAEGLTRIKDLCEAAKSELTINKKIDTSLAIDFVTNYLSEHAVYSTSLSKAPAQSDILDYFLFEQKKGFCIHFASTATLMFRMLGIPSRYVTGYLIPETVFKQQDNPNEYKAMVKDSFAHAWPEIYVEGAGWIPIESTPGNYRSGADWPLASQKPASAPTPTVPNQKPDNKPTVTPPPVKEPITPAPDKSNSSGHTESAAAKFQIPRWLFITLGCFLCIVFIIVAIVLRRKYIISKRMEFIHLSDTKKAVESICFEVYRLIKFENHMRLDFKDDAEYAQFIQNAIPCFNENEFITFSSICEKALFSKEGIPESELSFCQTIYYKLQAYEMNQIKQNKKGLTYLWIKYFIIL